MFKFYLTFTHVAQDETMLSPADSDSWLNVDPAQLETYLNQQWGNVRDRKLDQESLSLREKVQSFLNQTSDIDGVHFLGYVKSMCLGKRYNFEEQTTVYSNLIS